MDMRTCVAYVSSYVTQKRGVYGIISMFITKKRPIIRLLVYIVHYCRSAYCTVFVVVLFFPSCLFRCVVCVFLLYLFAYMRFLLLLLLLFGTLSEIVTATRILFFYESWATFALHIATTKSHQTVAYEATTLQTQGCVIDFFFSLVLYSPQHSTYTQTANPSSSSWWMLPE